MHSSRMRTARLLPVFPSMHCWGCTCSWGVYLVPGGVYLVLGGVPGPEEVYLVPGCVPGRGGWTRSRGCPWSSGVYLVLLGYMPRHSPLWTEWQTGVKILPCPKLRLRAVKISKNKWKSSKKNRQISKKFFAFAFAWSEYCNSVHPMK